MRFHPEKGVGTPRNESREVCGTITGYGIWQKTNPLLAVFILTERKHFDFVDFRLETCIIWTHSNSPQPCYRRDFSMSTSNPAPPPQAAAPPKRNPVEQM